MTSATHSNVATGARVVQGSATSASKQVSNVSTCSAVGAAQVSSSAMSPLASA